MCAARLKAWPAPATPRAARPLGERPSAGAEHRIDCRSARRGRVARRARGPCTAGGSSARVSSASARAICSSMRSSVAITLASALAGEVLEIAGFEDLDHAIADVLGEALLDFAFERGGQIVRRLIDLFRGGENFLRRLLARPSSTASSSWAKRLICARLQAQPRIERFAAGAARSRSGCRCSRDASRAISPRCDGRFAPDVRDGAAASRRATQPISRMIFAA